MHWSKEMSNDLSGPTVSVATMVALALAVVTTAALPGCVAGECYDCGPCGISGGPIRSRSVYETADGNPAVLVRADTQDCAASNFALVGWERGAPLILAPASELPADALVVEPIEPTDPAVYRFERTGITVTAEWASFGRDPEGRLLTIRFAPDNGEPIDIACNVVGDAIGCNELTP